MDTLPYGVSQAENRELHGTTSVPFSKARDCKWLVPSESEGYSLTRRLSMV